MESNIVEEYLPAEWISEDDHKILKTLSPQELGTFFHQALLVKKKYPLIWESIDIDKNDSSSSDISFEYIEKAKPDQVDIKPVFKAALIPMPKRYEYVDCHNIPYQTDLKVVHGGKTIYVELKNYSGQVPKAELDKFHRDVETKGDIFAGLFIGWNETKFYYLKGIPILLMKSKEYVDEGLDILFAIQPRKRIDKLCESMDNVVNIINILDKMSRDFNKNKDAMRGELLIFIERCKDIDLEYTDIKTQINLIDCHLKNHSNLYDFVLSLGEGTICKNTLTFGNVSFKLLKTKTMVTITKTKKEEVYTTSFELKAHKFDVIRGELMI